MGVADRVARPEADRFRIAATVNLGICSDDREFAVLISSFEKWMAHPSLIISGSIS
jgi:hypothetical protein